MIKYCIITLLLIPALFACSQEELIEKIVIKPVKTQQVEKSSTVLELNFPGTVRASKRAELSFDVPGRIVSLNAIEGSTVTKGDVIATLDDRDFKNNYESAQASLKEAKLTYNRYRTLIKEKAVSQASLDVTSFGFARPDVISANRELNSAREMVLRSS